jgi:hypothetical protein
MPCQNLSVCALLLMPNLYSSNVKVHEELGVYVAVKEGDDVSQAILNSWDQETAILFSTVISFWFGGRAMRKIRESKNG